MSDEVRETAHQYDTLFYEYQRKGAAQSAAHVLPAFLRHIGARSVLDVGCGAGAWVKAYKDLGVPYCVGVDGEYVDRSVLLMDRADFHARDITKPFDFGRQFDVVQCLEVAEHVPPPTGPMVIENIVRHGKKVLFSAAPPGQGGEDHINERSYDHWRDEFLKHDFHLFDFVRPSIRDDKAVEPWYRFNILFFAHESVLPTLPAEVRSARIPDRQHVADVSPLAYRSRKLVLRCLPGKVVSSLAVWKHRRMVASLHS
jgi:SAM-dependent methyltransferase